MNNKQGRPESKNADYFPHQTETSNELLFLERKYAAEGYRAYWRLLELVTKADDHHIKLQTENQTLTFRYGMNVPVEILDECIKYLVEVEFIDKHMYEEENIIWVPWVIEKLKPVYANRQKSPPQKEGNKIVSSSRNPQYSKVSKEKKRKPSIVVKDETTTDVGKVKTSSLVSKDIDDYKNRYPDLDVDKSLTKLKKYNPNYGADDATKWLDNDLAKGWNIKQPEWTYYPSGSVKIYCSKCGERESANDIRAANSEVSACCKVEYVPEPMNSTA